MTTHSSFSEAEASTGNREVIGSLWGHMPSINSVCSLSQDSGGVIEETLTHGEDAQQEESLVVLKAEGRQTDVSIDPSPRKHRPQAS